MQEIEKFIHEFKNFGTGKEIIDCFTNGYCYWFAYILQTRFPYGSIYYIPVDNHFVYECFNGFYDITGDCTEKYDRLNMISWAEYQMKELGSSHYNKLINDCILKV